VHAVVTADREEIGIPMELVVVGLHEGFVGRRIEIVVIVRDHNDAEGLIAHALERTLRGERVLTQHLRLGWIDPAFR
jgi:hypothetical protein